MLSVASLRRGRSAKSELEHEAGLSANFKDRKPKPKAKPPAPAASVVPHRRKPKVLKMKNLKVECFIDDAWHPATIKDGDLPYFLPGYDYTIVYDEDKYQETRVYDKTMRLPA